jgi:hypothetical protein
MLVSSNTFDNSTFFYEQLKFTWVVWVVIGVKVGGEIDPPSGDPITLYGTLKLTFPRPSKMTASGLDISHSFSNRDARNCGKLTRITRSCSEFRILARCLRGRVQLHSILYFVIASRGRAAKVPLW